MFRRFDTFKRLGIFDALATAGQSRTTSTIVNPVTTSAITPPPRRPHAPPAIPDTDFSRSRRRHASSISVRQVRPTLADTLGICSSSNPHCKRRAMNAGPTLYTARMVAAGNWRVWDRDRSQWVTDLLPSYPDELLRDLNGPASVPSVHEQPSDEGPTERLIRVAYLTASGAALGGPIAVWLFLPEPPGPGEAGCGLEVLGAFLFGPLVAHSWEGCSALRQA